MADEMVTMKHPDIEGTATATKKAFDEVWKEKGWKEVKAEEPLISAAKPKGESK